MTSTLRLAVRRVTRIGAAVGLVSLALTAAPPPASAGSYTSVSGAGSSWASVAIDQWSRDVRNNGLVINYNPDGSAAGRVGYIQDQYDFAGSDPPFRNGQDVLGGTGREVVPSSYSYVPDTAGGTAFMYHITVAGHLITNLRLSGETITKIFTGVITNWDNPEITHDYGAQLPNLPITPVIRSDGSGATYFLTRWMAHEYPSLWNPFCKRVDPGIHLPCPQTELYPPFGAAKAENGSNNVATYITSSYGDGSIGYDEYAYALNSHYPVVKVLNPAGYYVLPTASNVAVSLTKAVINEDTNSPDFLQQDLDSVYTFTDKRSYPLSSYSYLIVPRTPKPPSIFGTPSGKGRTLSTYIHFLLCAGQQQMAPLGYSPLPLNLVKGGLLQVSHMPGFAPGTDTLSNCNNPTFTNGKLTILLNAPYPSPCDKLGAPLNCVVKNGKAVSTGPGSSTKSGSGGTNGGTTNNGSSTGPGGTNGSSTGPGGSTQAGTLTGTITTLPANPSQPVPGVLTALGIIGAVVIPPTLAAWLRRRGQAHG